MKQDLSGRRFGQLTVMSRNPQLEDRYVRRLLLTQRGKTSNGQKKSGIAMEQKKKEYKKPQIVFIDVKKRTVTGAPEMVRDISTRFDQIVGDLAKEKDNSYATKILRLLQRE